MRPLLFELSAAPGLADALCRSAGLDRGEIVCRHFPDGESYVRLMTEVSGRDVAMLATLDRPDPKLLPLLYAATAARSGGARSVGLAAPYLAYMRQDKAFHPGEAVSSLAFARLLSDAFDWLVTVDPHLHRYPSLASLYAIPATAVSASRPVAAWIRANVTSPVLIGPDEESGQWVARIAALAGAPSHVLGKTRRGDYDVSIADPDLAFGAGETPVIVDDIASSAGTMIEAAGLLPPDARRPVCVAVHAIFAGDAYERLRAAGTATIASTNSVAHPTNAIDLAPELAPAIRSAIAAAGGRPREIQEQTT